MQIPNSKEISRRRRLENWQAINEVQGRNIQIEERGSPELSENSTVLDSMMCTVCHLIAILYDT